MEVTEMADAEAGDLEDENGIAVPDHVGAGEVTVVAADVGGDVGENGVAETELYMRRLAALAPAVKDVRDLRIGKQRVVRAMRAVHGDDVGQPAAGMVGAAEIGRDPYAARRVDVIGGMTGIGDGDVFGLGRQTIIYRHRARRARHRQALAALRGLRVGR